MASKVDIGPKIGIDGEAEFRKRLKEINTGLKTLGSEAKSVAAEFQGQENSTEALTARTDILTRQILWLKDGLALQTQMLQESARAYGEADERTQRWQQAVNNTTAEIAKLQHQLETETSKLDEAQDATGQFTAEIGRQERELQELTREYSNAVLEQGKSSKQAQELAGKIRNLSGELDTNRSKLEEATGAMGDMGDSADGLSGTLSGSLQVALGNLASQGFGMLVDAIKQAGQALVDMQADAMQFADDIKTLSSQTGLSIETLQEFDYMSDLADVSVETLQGSLTRLTRSMDSFRNGNAATTEAFEKLGFTVGGTYDEFGNLTHGIVDTKGNLKSAESVWYEVIDALGQVESATERDAIAMAIFGKSAQELNPIIDIGSEGLRELAQEAHDVNYVLSGEQTDALGEAQDEWARLSKYWEGVQRQIAAELAPSVEELIVAFADLVKTVDWASMVEGLTDVISGVVDLINAVKELVQWWNQFTGGTSMSDTMWDGGHSVRSQAAKISTPAVTQWEPYPGWAEQNAQLLNSAVNKPVAVKLDISPNAGKYVTAQVQQQQALQGPSARAQRR